MYVGFIDGKRVEVEGPTLLEAMTAAGYVPKTSTNSINRLVGQLTTGQRFTFTRNEIRHDSGRGIKKK